MHTDAQITADLERDTAVTVGVERAMLQHMLHEDLDMVAVLGEVAAALS